MSTDYDIRKLPKSQRPNPKRPQLWMGYCCEEAHSYDDQFRIIYPDGTVAWRLAGRLAGLSQTERPWRRSGSKFASEPKHCWHKIDMTQKNAVVAMRAYDKKQGRKTIFLGNI